jgi:hypothetical protein
MLPRPTAANWIANRERSDCLPGLPRCGNTNLSELLSHPARGIALGVTNGNGMFSGKGAPTLSHSPRAPIIGGSSKRFAVPIVSRAE